MGPSDSEKANVFFVFCLVEEVSLVVLFILSYDHPNLPLCGYELFILFYEHPNLTLYGYELFILFYDHTNLTLYGYELFIMFYDHPSLPLYYIIDSRKCRSFHISLT